MTEEYEIIRSHRRTLSMEITDRLTVLVRAPQFLPPERIRQFVEENSRWIEVHKQRRQQRLEAEPVYTREEAAHFYSSAKQYLPERTAYFAAAMGLHPARVKITSAKKRFGSCSGSNRICYSWRLMAYPPAAIDYVVVHELAHIRHKNHGKEFYACVASVLPDYKARRALLKG